MESLERYWRDISKIHWKWGRVLLFKVYGILIDNFEHKGEEDTIQYSYRLGTSGNYTWNSDDYEDNTNETLSEQDDDAFPNGWASIIDYQNSSNSYPYCLKRTKHLGRWSMWNGEKEVYYGWI